MEARSVLALTQWLLGALAMAAVAVLAIWFYERGQKQ